MPESLLQQMETMHACRFMIIPDMLKNAPMFKRIDPKLKVCHFSPAALIIYVSFRLL